MTLNQMKYFTTLVESKSFTEAAKCLFITQPNLSRQIQSMEDELGLKLLFRESRSFKLTPEGTILYKHFCKLLKDYEVAVDEAIAAGQGFDGTLNVGILDIMDITTRFPRLISNVSNALPQLELTLKRGSLHEVIESLNNETADIILTYGFSLFDQPDLVTVNVDTFNSCIMIPKSHPLAYAKEWTISDFKNDTFYQLKPSICQEGARYLNTLCEHAGFTPQTKWVDSMRDIMLWVETGNGVSITSDCSTEKNNPNVVIRPIEMSEAKGHDITFAWKKDNYNPAIALFMEQVERTKKMK